MDANREFWAGFIDLYQANECLWRVGTRDYANRGKKNLAYQQLARYSLAQDSGADIKWVKRKIQNLRTVFLKEHRKYKDSQRSGAGSDQVKKPTLWYYDLMKFVLDEEPSRTARSTEEPNTPEMFEPEEEESVDPLSSRELDVEPAVDEPADQATVRPELEESEAAMGTPQLPARRRCRPAIPRRSVSSSRSDTILRQAEEVLKNRPDRFEAIGDHLACELREMNPTQQKYAQRLVYAIISHGQDDELTNHSGVVLDTRQVPSTSYAPPPTHPPMYSAPVIPPQQYPTYPAPGYQMPQSPFPVTSSGGVFTTLLSAHATVQGDLHF
ncbi:uncharacterized protein LOC134949833 [Pseudophryne corroboree]|uniref:uncharacterized protein LOC134949833 n=1 Tax=Pseudophryne corroboree TaxID=495146 RepID=UPI003081EBB9